MVGLEPGAILEANKNKMMLLDLERAKIAEPDPGH
jgi:hypothetical protein